jgi:hypothetical protein
MGAVSSFPKMSAADEWALCPTWTTVPRSALGPALPSPHPLPPHCLCLLVALLIHSALAAASCVTETARNFLFGF